ncbi:MAG: bifunctional enoyl-CoA hydratase/phosphate acetyltransferase [Pseudomonadota bacterium]|nr:bifunctional enoyl-CoA hydratase/phosphate acetyltransferase [Pseudomonadota bacterium]
MNQDLIRNRPYSALTVGESASLTRTVGQNDIDLFAAISGDINPAHMDPQFAAGSQFGHVIVHGMWTAGLISAVLGTQLPGPGTIYLDQELRFRRPVAPGDVITATVTVREKREPGRVVVLDTVCTNQRHEAVLQGAATVLAPSEAIAWPRMRAPNAMVHRHDRLEALLRAASEKPPLRVAVVHPCSRDALLGALEARDAGLIEPVLVGPAARIRALAEEAQIALDGMRVEDVPHSAAAALRAVEMASQREVAALMKGSLHTDELLAAVVSSGSGLRTERRISHAYLMDLPGYPKPLVITDAAINIAPTLTQKRDICQNAIDLMHVMGVADPLVAVLAAVETINPEMPATLDAAALTQMARRGQITGAQVDGPLAFDNAISLVAAQTKGIQSTVAGSADILLAPNLEAGNMLAKQLLYFADADAAGLVLGARVPIFLTSRADRLQVRLASAALGKLVAERGAVNADGILPGAT